MPQFLPCFIKILINHFQHLFLLEFFMFVFWWFLCSSCWRNEEACVGVCLHARFSSILENKALKPSVSVDNILKSSIFSAWSDCSVVQLLGGVQLFATPWTAALPASPSFTISREFARTHVHWVSDAIPPSHCLSLPSPLVLNLMLVENLLVLYLL